MSYTQQQFAELPSVVLDALFDEEINQKFIAEIFPLMSEAQGVKMSELMMDVYFRALPLADFVAQMGRVVPDRAVYQRVTNDVLGWSFLPLAEYFETDVAAMITQNGGVAARYHRVVAMDQVIAQIRQLAEVKVADEVMSHRLNTVLATAVSGVRDDAQAREMLLRPVKTGGLGFDEVSVNKLLEIVRNVAGSYEQRGIAIATSTTSASRTPTAPQIPPRVPSPQKKTEPVKLPAQLPHANEGDIQPYVAALSVDDKKRGDSYVAKVHAVVGSMIETSDAQFFDEAMRRRLRGIAEVFLRGLRDAAATRTKLIEATSTGGMALPAATADQLMATFEKKAKDFHAFWKEGADFDRARYVAKQIEKHDLPRPAPTPESTQESTPAPTPVTFEPFAPVAPTIIPVSVPKKSTAPVIADDDDNDPERESAVAPAPQNLPMVAEQKNTLPRTSSVLQKNVVPLKPVALKPIPPKPTPVMSTPTPTRVTDVQPGPRLVNPAEELRRLTLIDFRRMAKNPVETTARIKEKIDVLSDHDFAERAKGKRAWEQSEVSRLYFDMLRETLDGVTVADIIRRRQAKQLVTLTAEEFAALTELSRTLRYE